MVVVVFATAERRAEVTYDLNFLGGVTVRLGLGGTLWCFDVTTTEVSSLILGNPGEKRAAFSSKRTT